MKQLIKFDSRLQLKGRVVVIGNARQQRAINMVIFFTNSHMNMIIINNMNVNKVGQDEHLVSAQSRQFEMAASEQAIACEAPIRWTLQHHDHQCQQCPWYVASCGKTLAPSVPDDKSQPSTLYYYDHHHVQELTCWPELTRRESSMCSRLRIKYDETTEASALPCTFRAGILRNTPKHDGPS
jgi:hypothetical protein